MLIKQYHIQYVMITLITVSQRIIFHLIKTVDISKRASSTPNHHFPSTKRLPSLPLHFSVLSFMIGIYHGI